MNKLILALILLSASVELIELEYVEVEGPGSDKSRIHEVADIVDGDTIDLYNETSKFTVRLIGIDTPEVHVDVDPGQYEDMDDSPSTRECLREAGKNASRKLAELAGDQVRISFDSMTDRKGYYGRTLAYVHSVNSSIDDSINHMLLESGLASVYPNEFERKSSFLEAEEKARSENLGLWQCRNISG